MITRDDVLTQACDDCMKELYSFVQPSVKWEDFVKECEIYTKCYKEWDTYNHAYCNREENPEKWEKLRKFYKQLDWEGKSITECIGPRPYEFYYLPKEIMNDICDSYVNAYNIDSQQELLNIIQILKDYCRKPIVDKYIEDWTDETGFHHPGYRSYGHPDNLEKEIIKIIKEYDDTDIMTESKDIVNKFFEFLDMAGNFYNWNRDLNSFNTTVYLGPSPCSSKEKVIENWKKYKGKDIEIDEDKIKKEYYGDED